MSEEPLACTIPCQLNGARGSAKSIPAIIA
jgi:hypothetical protein